MAKQMEQFEKWWRKNKGWLECIDSSANYDAKVTAKIVWKAALECVRHIIIHESDGPSNPKDLMEWLNEELGNE